MDAKKIDLARTNEALSALSEALNNLSTAVTAKKNDIKNSAKQQSALLKDRENRLEILSSSSENILNNIDEIIQKLDKVLDDNGSSNDNN